MGVADFVNVLYSKYLTYDPADPKWIARDRFFLDPGHMSPMLYSVLALTGKYSIDELRQFVRNQPEVDKEKILKVFSDLKSKDQDVVAVALEKKKILDEHGISMEQTDDFWVEPKADDQV